MKKQIVNSVPVGLKNFIRSRILGQKLPDYIGNQYRCSVCHAGLKYFLPMQEEYFENAKKYGYIYSFDDSETLNYRQYLCPACFSNDRDRMFALYYKIRLSKKPEFSMLDFAPAWPIANFFRTKKNIKYRTADLFSEKVDDKGVDICNMTIYANGQFGFFICSHVVEHVKDPDKALSELYRILKPGGKGLLLVPIIVSLDQTQEDESIVDPALRWKYYGQEDHLRMFAKKDFIQRIQKAGFKVEELSREFFGLKNCQRYGIDEKSVLYCVSK